MKKVALINQRYGKEVNGGSEYYTKLLAEHLSGEFEIEVLTTTALSYESWDNYYNVGEEQIDGVTVRRFRVDRPRDVQKQRFSGKLMNSFGLKANWLNRMWVEAQGPYSPDLIQYITENRDNYDIFIFVTYLYYSTVYGMPEVKDRAIFIPTAHDEYCIYYKVYEDLFRMPKGIVFLTEEERDFVHKTFKNADIPHTVAGVGINIPDQIDTERFRKKYNIDKKYMIYTGRVDESKGCGQMFEAFRIYREKAALPLELVVMGQQFMDIPQDEHIHYLGFVPEEDKFDAVAGAEALWLPSEFESLSISVLEAMALGKPILVNGKCEVLKGHCVKSGGGFYYQDLNQAVEYLEWFASKEEHRKQYDVMSQGAYDYIRKYYTWDKIMEKIIKLSKCITS